MGAGFFISPAIGLNLSSNSTRISASARVPQPRGLETQAMSKDEIKPRAKRPRHLQSAKSSNAGKNCRVAIISLSAISRIAGLSAARKSRALGQRPVQALHFWLARRGDLAAYSRRRSYSRRITAYGGEAVRAESPAARIIKCHQKSHQLLSRGDVCSLLCHQQLRRPRLRPQR